MFCEPCIFYKNEEQFKKILEIAKTFGYKHVVGVVKSKKTNFKKIEKEIKECGKDVGIQTYFGVLLNNKRQIKASYKFRKNVDLILVEGGDLAINRIAVETSAVDFLISPEKNRKDPGFNHIFAKAALRNEIGVIINFSYVSSLKGYKLTREIEYLRTIIRTWNRYKFPLTISSCATNEWELKHPKILMSFLMLLGVEIKEVKKTLSCIPLKIIKTNIQKRKKEWIMPGVRVVKWGVMKK